MFVHDDWLAIDEGDGKMCATLQSFHKDETDSGQLLKSNLHHNMFDDHMWLSVGYRQNKSSFNRLQRVCCCLATLIVLIPSVILS